MRALASLGVVLTLSGCAGSGAQFREFPAATEPGAADSATLLVFRSADTPQYAVRSASLVVDDVAQPGLAPGQFQRFNVAPGRHRIVVEMWDVPGRCELVVDVAGGSERYFEVSPRLSNAVAPPPMVLAPVDSLGTLLANGAVMMTGLTVESVGNACGGAFEVVEQPGEHAQPRLASLRASR